MFASISAELRLICVFLVFILACNVNGSDDYRALRKEAEAKLDRLENFLKKADEHGLETGCESVSVSVAKAFLEFAQWDYNNKEKLRDILSEWKKGPKNFDPAKKAEGLAEFELRETIKLLDEVWEKSKNKKDNLWNRRGMKEFNPAKAEIKDGWVKYKGRVVYPYGFNVLQDHWKHNNFETLATLYLDCMGTEKQGRNESIREKFAKGLNQLKSFGLMGDVLIGHHGVPEKAKESNPEIAGEFGHGVGYDIDHPLARGLWKKTLSKVVGITADSENIKLYDIMNEPSWLTAKTKWTDENVQLPSRYTIAGYRSWLKDIYKDISNLNSSWGKDFASFSEIQSFQRTPENKAAWYDWCRYNQIRCTDFFRFMHDEIKQHDPQAKCHVKFINHNVLIGSGGPWSIGKEGIIPARHKGLDREAVMEIMEVNGCDTRITDGGNMILPHPYSDPSEYALNWRAQSMCFDFMKSLQPDKLLYDSEWHSVQTIKYRNQRISPEHMKLSLWLAHMHGMGANITWYWGRKGVSARGGWQGSFYANITTQPRLLYSYLQNMLRLNSYADKVHLFSEQKRPVRILYSNASAIQDTVSCDAAIIAYESLYFSGLPIGFVTEKMLQENALSDCECLIAANTGYVEDETVAAVKKFIDRGGEVVNLGDDTFKFNKRGKKRSLKDYAFIKRCRSFDLKSPKKLAPAMVYLMKKWEISSEFNVEPSGNGSLWGVLCRSVQSDNKSYVLLMNLTKQAKGVSLKRKGKTPASAKEIIEGVKVNPENITLKSRDVLFMEIP
ncbi:Beta-galactosidase [Sedimentisphaera cyanobacteriorum]|uniref:Beta-galactosidase n=1 Tax=Sedimentisphaera cyanobacteriorum TaxID=1940790 RepID=A0A1Q2HQ87_9BACT|nr:beta-galactosidase [Sedimentisphaera cyanobacteriorum]AQQ09598.1 Beta-galactosidase [Sedimentisphaera cyanobacteriorum]